MSECNHSTIQHLGPGLFSVLSTLRQLSFDTWNHLLAEGHIIGTSCFFSFSKNPRFTGVLDISQARNISTYEVGSYPYLNYIKYQY